MIEQKAFTSDCKLMNEPHQKTPRCLSIEQVQHASLEILRTIINICDENGFRYWLMYGSLLGAVRHGGFIPWDDDIDIGMPRDDYDKLLLYFTNNADCLGPLVVLNYNTVKNSPILISMLNHR